jgi:DNA invertase Pin-like site-specific DNA recombinase
MQKALAYVRVSSKDQTDGYSIPAQRKLLKKYAGKKSFELVEIFEDDESAKRTGRKYFGKMLEYLEKNRDVKIILTEKTDRIYRNLKDYVLIDELDVTVHLVKENEIIGKDSSSHQKLIHGVKLVMAKHYVDNLSEEVKKGYNEKAEQGIYPGSMVPLGYVLTRVDKKSFPVVDENNRKLIEKMFEYYATGLYSLQAVAQKVKDEGLFVKANIPPSSRTRTMNKATVQRILRNPFYYGAFTWNGELYQNAKHEKIIERELWEKVQTVLSRTPNKQMKNKYKSVVLPFRGLIQCGECGRTVTGYKKVKPSGLVYTFYRCTHFNNNCSQKQISGLKIDTQFDKYLEGLKLSSKTVEYVREGLKRSLELKNDTEDKIKENLIEEKQRLESMLKTMYEDRLDGTIPKEFYNQRFKEYSKKLESIADKLKKRTRADLDYYRLGINILELAKNASTLYKQANDEEKRELLNYLISNSKLKNGKVDVYYKKPFDLIFENASRRDWRDLLYDVRTNIDRICFVKLKAVMG